MSGIIITRAQAEAVIESAVVMDTNKEYCLFCSWELPLLDEDMLRILELPTSRLNAWWEERRATNLHDEDCLVVSLCAALDLPNPRRVYRE